MLKDIGVAVSKIRETRTVYIYAAREGMMSTYSSNIMRNNTNKICREDAVVVEQAHPLGPAYSNKRCREEVRMVLLLYGIISPVLLHICFLDFWHCYSYILQHFNETFSLHLFHWFFIVCS